MSESYDGEEPDWYALDYDDLLSATGGFGEGHVISRGIPHRTLYTGTLRDGREVDVLMVRNIADGTVSSDRKSISRRLTGIVYV